MQQTSVFYMMCQLMCLANHWLRPEDQHGWLVAEGMKETNGPSPLPVY